MGHRMTSKHAINLTAFGHCAAILTIAIWGTTFISTKVLLAYMLPITILVCRFVLGFIALAFVAAFVWAVYSILIKQISTWGYDVILTTRRIFFYGLVIMLPCAIPLGFEFDPSLLIQPLVVGNLLFLGLGASALCFVTWNFAVTTIGAVKTSAYIYMSPVITVLTAAIVLAEPVTLISCFGVILTLSGLIISENVRASRKSIRKTSMSA